MHGSCVLFEEWCDGWVHGSCVLFGECIDPDFRVKWMVVVLCGYHCVVLMLVSMISECRNRCLKPRKLRGNVSQVCND